MLLARDDLSMKLGIRDLYPKRLLPADCGCENCGAECRKNEIDLSKHRKLLLKDTLFSRAEEKSYQKIKLDMS